MTAVHLNQTLLGSSVDVWKRICILIQTKNVPFCGQVLTKDVLKSDPDKVNVMQQWPTPSNVTELQNFLGSVNYLCKFIPYLSDLIWPLQELLKSSNDFDWTQIMRKPSIN